MAEDGRTRITKWKIHHTTAGGHSVDRKQFGEFLRSDQGRDMIAEAAKAVRIGPQGKEGSRSSRSP